MSRGLGKVELRIKAALEAASGKSYSYADLAKIVFPGDAIKAKHLSSVRRAVLKLQPIMGLRKGRDGIKGRGWQSWIGFYPKE